MTTCTHLDRVRVMQLPESDAGCEECLKTGDPWPLLRIRLEYGKVGCCDSSPNRHGSAHARSARHPLARSIEPGEEWSWCFVDDLALVIPEVHGEVRIPPSPPGRLMASGRWPSLSYSAWAATCDTLHTHTQVLGKLAVELAPPEPQLQHAALRLTARGWETPTLPAPDGSGSLVAALDLRTHEAVLEHSDGRDARIALTPNRTVAEVTRETVEAVGRLAGPVEVNPKPQEVPWEVPLDEDQEHATYDTNQVSAYFTAATQAALALAEFRGPYRGRLTPVNAWWGTFDLAVALYSGKRADPPGEDFIMRNSGDAEMIEVGWWPGDRSKEHAAFFAFAHPAPEGFSEAELSPAAARWDEDLGEFVLDWEDVRQSPDPRADALAFLHSAFGHACEVCVWDPFLAGSAEGHPPPIH